MQTREPDLVAHAPVKINLTLEVLGLRPDGFHEIRSILMPLALGDDIRFWRRHDGAVALTVTADPGICLATLPDPEKNLVVRAARLLQSVGGASKGATIELHKRAPLGGGLGGGSADAAATLCALNKLWELGLSGPELTAHAAKLGCDVPALTLGGPVVMEGRGELIRPIAPPPGGVWRRLWVVVANPGICCPTCNVYRSHNGGLTVCPDFFHNALLSVRAGDVEATARFLYNGLQPVVFAHYPATRQLADKMRAAGALGVLLSGSGASVFALVRDRGHGLAVRERLGGDIWSVVTTTLPDGVMAAHGPLEP